MKFSSIHTRLLAVIFLIVGHQTISAQDFTEIKKLLQDSIPEIYTGEFGRSVAIDGNIAIVGAPRGGSNGVESGMAVIYEINTGTGQWEEVKRIIPADGEPFDRFGYSVSVSGDIVLVGSWLNGDGSGDRSGAAYIYEKDSGGSNNWGEVKRLTASDGASLDRFGYSVSLSGDVAIVGSSFDDDKGSTSGSAYVYSKDAGGTNNWGEVKKLTASDGASGDEFGISVGISGDVAIVGAHGHDEGFTDTGAAYVYRKDSGGTNNWGEVKKVTASDRVIFNRFGISVSVSADVIIVGGANRNSAYIYSKDTGGIDNWGEVTRLTTSEELISADLFGISVSVSGDTAIVGAHSSGISSGFAYIFSKDMGGIDNWGEVTKVTASDGANDDNFGISVSVNGNVAIVGAYRDDDGGSNTGSAYILNQNSGGIDNWGQVKKVDGSESGKVDQFGYSVSVSGNIAIVGALRDDGAANSSGTAYIHSKDMGGINNWGVVAKLAASDGSPNDFFGISVSVSGDVAIVGASGDDDSGGSSGSAYIFGRNSGGANNWGQVTKVAASDGANDDFFGISVSVSGDVAIVGAHRDDDGGINTGSAYIFNQNSGGVDNWGQVKKVTASDGASDDNFGFSVSVSGDIAVIGAYKPFIDEEDVISDVSKVRKSKSNTIGAAYIFSKDHGAINGWGQIAKLTADDETSRNEFGYSVSVSGDVAIVGARGDGSQKGAAYIYGKDQGTIDSWGQVTKLTASDGALGDEFGYSVSMSGDVAIVGARREDDNGNSSGSAYIYGKDEGGNNMWGEVKKLTASDGAADDEFGASISVSGEIAIVGTPSDGDQGDLSGSTYIFGTNTICTDSPKLNCPADVDLLQSEYYADTASMILVGIASATASCGLDSLYYTDELECVWGPRSKITRTWRALDMSGNDTTCVQIINIIDTPKIYIFGDFEDGTTYLCSKKPFTFESNYICNSDGYEWSYSGSDPLTVHGQTSATLTINIDLFGGGDHALSLKVWKGSDTLSGSLTVIIVDPVFCEFFTNCSSDYINMNKADMANNDVPNTVHAVRGVNSDGVVDSGDKYHFIAGEFIDLNPGFEVENNAVFIATIETCLSSLISIEEKLSKIKNEEMRRHVKRILSRD